MQLVIDLLEQRTYPPELTPQMPGAKTLRACLRHPKALADVKEVGDQPPRRAGAPLDQVVEPAGAPLQPLERTKRPVPAVPAVVDVMPRLALEVLHAALEPMRQHLESARVDAAV